MTYRELLELYREGKLEEEKRREVEDEIEKQDAISDYLYEVSEIPEFKELDDGTEREAEGGTGEERFVSLIRKSIRRAFIKTGVIVGTAVFALILCVIFLLPRVVSLCYYNPSEIVAEEKESGLETDRMSLDFAVYSELFLPGAYRNTVVSEALGYGSYNILIPQELSYDGRFTAVNGRLTRGKLTLYNTNILKPPTGNAFVLPETVDAGSWNIVDMNTGEPVGPAGKQEEALKKLEELDEEDWYLAFVSLKEITEYESFYSWLEEKELIYGSLWCAVYSENQNGDFGGYENVGFTPKPVGEVIYGEEEAYPKLCLQINPEREDDPADGEGMKTHFISLLRYLKDHGKIQEMMEGERTDYSSMIEDVEKNGLRLYGFAIGARKETILELNKDPAVSYIYTTPLP